ncbi:uncharacterized protein LOC124438113 isoform X2 [Xenia sp. Carnegie-2017]|uniref:uncharacterized protein LOC124438113 isoform X2 n=1 Tax=Xenia sp. Carnegie-2017 TaxID=2897299 RepID=UPI001F03DC7C|nr:uncharacterized protein LOC124438113 isoform X2 [Xenia sp. Carnegie-2017]
MKRSGVSSLRFLTLLKQMSTRKLEQQEMSSLIQLYKTPSGRHPYLSRWSRDEPARHMATIGNSDHWSKLKHKTGILTLECGDGGVAFWIDHNFKEEQRRSQLLQRQHQQQNESLSSIGRRKTFIETQIFSLDSEKTGTTSRRNVKRETRRSSAANERARAGFRYWILDKPVHKGKYTTGAKTSILGIGKSFLP